MTRQLRVFLSYSSEDKQHVRALYDRLHSHAFIDPWLDDERLLGGQELRYEIKRALLNTDVVLVCLSKRSVTKDGFVQREIRWALDQAEAKPEGIIFIIPCQVEPCEVPSRLTDWKCVELFAHDGYQRLLNALYARAAELKIATQLSLANSSLTPLDKTMSNPHYESDTKSMELNHYVLSSVVGPDTVLVVVGCWMGAELCDRPVAEMMRDEIDKRGTGHRYRRGIVLTDTEWLRNEELHRLPAIAVGGPSANALTEQVDRNAPSNLKWTADGASGALIVDHPPRVALWGLGASTTRLSAERYLLKTDGLDSFLKLCWKVNKG